MKERAIKALEAIENACFGLCLWSCGTQAQKLKEYVRR